ncbi:MAG TPA: DUF4350 domain-containing protein [Holophagaceae bacterium]|nr:DUF4350 domain-containing protein [Holophagaceae bacterium]
MARAGARPARRGDRAMIAALIALLVAILGLAGWYVARNIEVRNERAWVGYHGEAETDDFLAAARLLGRMGRDTHPVEGLPLPKALGARDALILPTRSLRLTPGQVAGLKTWVAGGGLLVAEGTFAEEADSDRADDPLFEAFGAREVKEKLEPPVREDGEAFQEFEDRRKAFEREHGVFELEINGTDFKADLGPYERIEDRAPGGDPAAVHHLVSRHEGEGTAILFTHLYALDNDHIREEDHADFLAALVSKRPAGAKVWIVYREEPPSLMAWLRANAWMVMTALGVLVLLGLWRGLRRLGPTLPDPPLDRRSLLEHLAAAGRFQWSVREGEALLASAQAALKDRLRMAHPALSVLPPDALVAALAERSGLPEARVFKALRYGRHADARDFTEAIQTLELLRNLP